jgi:hypothetical protein
VIHGFVRTALGAITTFDCPGALFTSPVGIDSAGAITGDCIDSSERRGFVRTADGAITTFVVSGAAPGAGNGTSPNSINPEGTITGDFVGESFASHGFVRTANGSIITLDVPGALSTFPASNNPLGIITGWINPPSNTNSHGFIAIVELP